MDSGYRELILWIMSGLLLVVFMAAMFIARIVMLNPNKNDEERGSGKDDGNISTTG